MATISVGDVIPGGTFRYVPYTAELDDGVSFFHDHGIKPSH